MARRQTTVDDSCELKLNLERLTAGLFVVDVNDDDFAVVVVVVDADADVGVDVDVAAAAAAAVTVVTFEICSDQHAECCRK